MNKKSIIKKILSAAGAFTAFLVFGMNVFSVIDYTAGEGKLRSDETTKYEVKVLDAGGEEIAAVPIGIGIRGDASGNNTTDLLDVITIAKYIIGVAGENFEDSLGYMMADVNLDKKVDLLDAINVAKYIVAEGSHEEKWQKVLGKKS